MQIGQQIREDGPQSHLVKKGTPTMGGVLIIFAVVISTLLWTNLSNNYVWLILLVTVGYGLIGFIDDYRKLIGKNSKGISGKTRLAAEIIDRSVCQYHSLFKPGFQFADNHPFF